MDTHRMRCFLSLAEELHFSKAAEKQCLAQSSMSQQIQNLEEELGVKLFIRNNRKVLLTTAGEYLQKEFTRLLENYEAVTNEVRKIDGQRKNNLNIGYHGPFNWKFLNTILQTYRPAHPQIRLSLMMENWGEIISKLITKEIDAAFIEGAELDDNKQIEKAFLMRDYVCFALHRSHPLAGRSMLSSKDIRNEPLVMVDTAIGKKSIEKIHQRLIKGGIDLYEGSLMKNFESCMAMVASGVAISPMPRSFKQTDQSEIVFIDYDSEDAFVEIYAVWLKDNHSPALTNFIEHLASIDN